MSRKHSEPHEEHADETWLVPYADLLTLLLALFIVLFAMGKTDEKKLGQMGRSFNIAFGGGGTTMFPFDNMAPQLVPGESPPASTNRDTPNKFDVPPSAPPASANALTQEALRETIQLLQLKESIDRYIKMQGLVGQLEAQSTEDGVRLRIKDSALFSSGEAYLRPESQKLASDIAKLLIGLPQQIVVAGHTDNVPINTGQFPSNWELSGMRAVNFMRYLLSQEASLKPQNFSAVGYGEYRPLRPNSSDENRSKNRRVEVWIIRAQKPTN
ncbi:MAG TPA: flagellar motor protein MotB [Negativicutes bacterium]|nr:flagellar motor protein MotB [Negativicutes bacterium]